MNSHPNPTAVLYLATWLPPQLHEEFSAWCDDHHREQLSLPGFLRARRFELDTSFRLDDPPQYLTMYDLVSLDALSSNDYIDHMKSSPGLPDFLRGSLRLERRDCTILAAYPHPWWPPAITSMLDIFELNDDARGHELRMQIDQLPSDGVDGLVLRVIDSDDNEPLVLIDHEPTTHELIDSLTASTGSLRSSWRCCFDEQSQH